MKNTTKKYDTREIMKNAWKYAKEKADRFGGKAREYISFGLRQAWKDEKYHVLFQSRYNALMDKTKSVYNAIFGDLVNQCTDYPSDSIEYKTAFNELNNLNDVIDIVKRGIKKKFPKLLQDTKTDDFIVRFAITEEWNGDMEYIK